MSWHEGGWLIMGAGIAGILIALAAAAITSRGGRMLAAIIAAFAFTGAGLAMRALFVRYVRWLGRALAPPRPAQLPELPPQIPDFIVSRHQELIAQQRLARFIHPEVAAVLERAMADIDPDPALGCPCCPGGRSNDCLCAIPCGDPMCQAIDPEDAGGWGPA